MNVSRTLLPGVGSQLIGWLVSSVWDVGYSASTNLRANLLVIRARSGQIRTWLINLV
jgi:hypothetical protein